MSNDAPEIPRGYGIPTVDLSYDTDRRTIVDAEEGRYLGQPDTILLEDGTTMLVAYPLGHGGPDTVLKRSADGGLTWGERLPVPESFAGDHNAPTLHRVVDPAGARRLLLVVSYPRMIQSISSDDGVTWTPLAPMFDAALGTAPGFKGHAPPKSVIPISGNRYLMVYHDHFMDGSMNVVEPIQVVSEDGGLTWSLPHRIGRFPGYPGAQPCEPCLLRSPDGKQILCLMRENSRTYNSMMMTSDDEGSTWSEIRELPAALTGDRHVARYAPDGRIVVTFRDMTHLTPTPGDFVAWVGTHEDIIAGREGQYRVRLLRNLGRKGDTGYAGLELRDEDTFVSTTYCVLARDTQPVVVSVRFTMDEIDSAARRQTVAQKPAGYTIPLVDLAHEPRRQVVVDREAGQYLGHPTTVLLDDGSTMIAVYPKGHGRGAIVMKRSADGGLSWGERLPVPQSWATSLEVPTIYAVRGPDGTQRLIMFSGLYPIRIARSEDGGATWSELAPIGEFGGVVAMADCIPVSDGRLMAFFHDDGRFLHGSGERDPIFRVYRTTSADAGLTWNDPEVVVEHFQADLCEPGAVRSPDGRQIALLLRENSRRFNSFVTFSDDEGGTWSGPRELPAALTGDRHQAKYAPDGRLFISFRDTTRESPTRGDWVGWVGTYDDIRNGTEGQYRIRLMDNLKGQDCAYPAVDLLPDGAFVVTTYGHWSKNEEPYVVSVRLRLDETDARAPTG